MKKHCNVEPLLTNLIELAFLKLCTQYSKVHIILNCNGTFTKIEFFYIIKYVSKFQRIEIIPRMFFDFSWIKLKSLTEENRKLPNLLKLNNLFLNNPRVVRRYLS